MRASVIFINLIVLSSVLASGPRTKTEQDLLWSNSATLRNEPASLVLSHAWIVVTTGAPQRTALETAGFRIAPTVNRHDGQGTASITVEFLNGFLELMYPDPRMTPG